MGSKVKLGLRRVGVSQTEQKARTNMKKAVRKLPLNKQTIRVLVTDDLTQAAGGWIRPPISWSCPQPSLSGCCPQTE